MTLVVKVGGAVGNTLDPVLSDLAGRHDFVLVHGGSNEVDRLGATLGTPAEYYTSPSGVVSRRSDAAHLAVVVLALAGKVQTEIVAEFAKRRVRAVVDGHTVRLADDLSGRIESVNVGLLRLLLAAGIVPVVGPPAVTEAGTVVNVDADRVAAHVAVALGSENLLLLTNVPGLMRDPADPASLIPHVGRDEIERVLPLARGRMRKKLLAARDALIGGVPRVVIAPSGGMAPVGSALQGRGTVVE